MKKNPMCDCQIKKDVNREWPEPWREVTVKLEGYKGETIAFYTGDGWMISMPLLCDQNISKVVEWKYTSKSNT